MAALDRDEITRYSRNILLEEVGRAGQEKWKRSRVLVVGAGGLGSPVLLYLAAAGVGHLTIMESDRVDLTNLQRQILFSTDSVGQPKAELARDRLLDLNPQIDVHVIGDRLTPTNGSDIFQSQDLNLVIDGSDNFGTRFLVNDLCVKTGIPLISGGILRFYGMVLGMHPGQTPCYRCVFEHPPEPGTVPSCGAAGVLGSVAGMIGSLMASEALKFLLGIGPSIMGQMVRVDALDLEFRRTALPSGAPCPACQGREFDPFLSDYYDVECAAPFWMDPPRT